MAVQVVIHGIPLGSPASSARPWGWLRSLGGVFRRHCLWLDPERVPASRCQLSSAQDLGTWVGAIQVSQVPEPKSEARVRPSPSLDPYAHFPSMDPVAWREAQKVRRIFVQNQISRVSSARRPHLRAVGSEGDGGSEVGEGATLRAVG